MSFAWFPMVLDFRIISVFAASTERRKRGASHEVEIDSPETRK
jgi:hypothetical protein